MASISRIRSRSVSTAPLTRATGFPEDAGAGVGDVVTAAFAAFGATSVGACDATTCALQLTAETITATPIAFVHPTWNLISSPPLELSKSRGEGFPLPRDESKLELRLHRGNAERFVRLANVALAAELSGRDRHLRVAVAGTRVIGRVDEEIRRVRAVADDLSSRLLTPRRYVDIHRVLVVARGAGEVCIARIGIAFGNGYAPTPRAAGDRRIAVVRRETDVRCRVRGDVGDAVRRVDCDGQRAGGSVICPQAGCAQRGLRSHRVVVAVARS